MGERGERHEEEWISAQDVSLADLVGPQHLLREAAQRQLTGKSGDDAAPAPLDARAPVVTCAAGRISLDHCAAGSRAVRRTSLDARAGAPSKSARVRAYRMYLVKHIGIMTCALPPSRFACGRRLTVSNTQAAGLRAHPWAELVGFAAPRRKWARLFVARARAVAQLQAVVELIAHHGGGCLVAARQTQLVRERTWPVRQDFAPTGGGGLLSRSATGFRGH